METIILLVSAAVLIFGTIAAVISRYKRCKPDQLLVISGRTGKKTDGSGETSTAKVIHGGGAFVWPVIQEFSYLDLKPMAIEVDLRDALSKQNIRINVPSVFTVAIDGSPKVRTNAAERLNGLDRQSIASLAQDIIFGQMRQVIAQMTIEEINADRETFLQNISGGLEDELMKIGLKLINVNVTDIKDESGYLEALGKKAAAEAINKAKIEVSESNKEGAIGEAKANREKEIEVANERSSAEIGVAKADQLKRTETASANSEAEIGEAAAESRQRTQTATLNASAIAGENEAAKNIANTTADRRVAEAEANRKTITAQKVKAAEAERDSYAAEKEAEDKRAEKEQATLNANVIVPATIEKEKVEIAAEARANANRTIAQGDADAIFFKMEAEAKGDYARLSEQAKGIAELVEAAGSADAAIALMVADKLERLYEIRVEAIKNIKIDKVTVWDQGSGNGQGSTANFLDGMLKAVPGFEEVFSMAGKELPSILQGAGTKMANELEAKMNSVKSIEAEKETVAATTKKSKKDSPSTDQNKG